MPRRRTAKGTGAFGHGVDVDHHASEVLQRIVLRGLPFTEDAVMLGGATSGERAQTALAGVLIRMPALIAGLRLTDTGPAPLSTEHGVASSLGLWYPRDTPRPSCRVVPLPAFTVAGSTHATLAPDEENLLKERRMDIYVGNLSFDTSEEGLRNAFTTYGEVAGARMITDRDTGRSRGFGFVEMPNAAEAEAAIRGLNGQELQGRTLTVNESKPRENTGRGGYGGGGGGGRGAGPRW